MFNQWVTADQINNLNSATKYPSILTYHELDPKGNLTDQVQVPFTGEVILTEKIDGTNTRVILFPDGDFVIGSKEELLYARGDRILNGTLGIVENVISVAESLPHSPGHVTVFYLETYGGNINGFKQYTRQRQFSTMVFDVADFSLRLFGELMEMPRSQVASWRDHGNQPFLPWHMVDSLCVNTETTCVPMLGFMDSMPEGVEETHEFMRNWFPIRQDRAVTYAELDNQPGWTEGIVARSADRKTIAKLRFESYIKALQTKASNG